MRFEDTDQYKIAKAVYDKLMEDDILRSYYPDRHSQFGCNVTVQWTEHPLLYVTSDILDQRIRGVGGGTVEKSYYFTILITQILGIKSYADDFSKLEDATDRIYNIHRDNYLNNYGLSYTNLQFMPDLTVDSSEGWDNWSGKGDMMIMYRWISGTVVIR